MQNLHFRQSNARGYPVGASHGRARHSDQVVEQARAWRAAGMTYRAIGEALGAPLSTVQAWTARRRRIVAPVRVIVTRRPTRLPTRDADGQSLIGKTNG